MYLDSSTRAGAELREDPSHVAREYWKMDQEYNAKEVVNFSGPEDAKYIDYLRSKLEAISVGLELCGLNYTKKHVEDFSVNGYSGASIYANSGGGSLVCCALLPRRWNKDLAVTVRWNYDEKIPGTAKERIVSVPRYSEGDKGFLAVHFYPDDTVKVLVTTKTNQYPGYPYPRPGNASFDETSGH